jgi:hypothetical protein
MRKALGILTLSTNVKIATTVLLTVAIYPIRLNAIMPSVVEPANVFRRKVIKPFRIFIKG